MQLGLPPKRSVCWTIAAWTLLVAFGAQYWSVQTAIILVVCGFTTGYFLRTADVAANRGLSARASIATGLAFAVVIFVLLTPTHGAPFALLYTAVFASIWTVALYLGRGPLREDPTTTTPRADTV